jgi:eukaryotic-like serine/threonine-protein kinase
VSATQKLLRFGVFELNLDTEELRKSDSVVKLPPQPLKLLALLANHAGQVVSRDQIQRKLWDEDSEVDVEHVVNKCIKQIRTVLGDNADKPLYIETLPRQGYRFIAPVVSKEIPAPRPMVVESDSGEQGRIAALTGSGTGAPAAVVGALAPDYSAAVLDSDAAAGPASEVPPTHESRPRVRRARLLWISLAVVLLALAGGGLYWRAHRGRVLTEKDTIVVAEFDNKTGDTVFDFALRQGLSSQLEQSPFLRQLPDSRIRQTLVLMKEAKDARLSEELARKVCQRTGSTATIEGSISTLGNLYVVGVKALDCHNGDLLADEQVTAADKDHVLKALGQAATKLRKKLGESLASVQKYDAPPEDVTTASLEALQAYSLGRRALNVKGDYPAAIALFQRAIDLDPNFAVAYLSLASGYDNTGQPARALESIRQAYKLREHLSEHEKLNIDARFNKDVSGNLEAARKAYELSAQIYPRDSIPPNHLGIIDLTLGDYGRGLAAFQQAHKLEPESAMLYGNIIWTNGLLGRLDEAMATAQEAQARGINSPGVHFDRYLVEFLQHDSAGMEKDKAELVGKPGLEDEIFYFESDTAASGGQFAKARELTRRAVDSAQHADQKEAAAADEAESAVREALVGNVALAKQQAQAALALSGGPTVQVMAAVALGLAGDSAQATRLAEGLAERFPEDTTMQSQYLPSIRAAIALRTGSSAKAVEVLSPAAPYELGWLGTATDFNLYPVYFRGQAFLALRQGGEAAAEFRKILDHPGVVLNEPIGALAHLGLGRAYTLSGDTAKAKAAYQDFLTLWKDADPDIPIYQQAKAEYARLR